MKSKLLYFFTRTPLHVGVGASVGAIDQPIKRERHTGFPVIPASSLKGSFADQWPVSLRDDDQQLVRVTSTIKNNERHISEIDSSGAAWLFGSDDNHLAFAGSLIFSEARLLAFPIRSARGSYAWITCPLMLQRAMRDGVLSTKTINEPEDNEAIYLKEGPLSLPDNRIVLEEYCFSQTNDYPVDLAEELASLIPSDAHFDSIKKRLVILSNGMMSHFATTACEIAQHVRISDETGTAEGTGLFNQENVPSDTLFYSVLSATKSRVPHADYKNKTDADALAEFTTKLRESKISQFGGDASTGLGFCSVSSNDANEATPGNPRL